MSVYGGHANMTIYYKMEQIIAEGVSRWKGQKVPPKSAISAFNDCIKHAIECHGLHGSCLVTSAILSEFLRAYKVRHEVVDGYLILGNQFYTRHVWVEVAYKKGTVTYDVFEGAKQELFRLGGCTRCRNEPDHLNMLQDTRAEIDELVELSMGIEKFKKNRHEYYGILLDRDMNLMNNTWKAVLMELSMCARTIGFPVDLKKAIML